MKITSAREWSMVQSVVQRLLHLDTLIRHAVSCSGRVMAVCMSM